jgi:DNA mismatch repair protein MutS2
MDAKTLDKLEFSSVRAMVAERCACSLGQRRANAMEPSPVVSEVRERLAETTEARTVLDTSGGVPLGGISDVDELLQRARLGSTLGALELLAVCNCLRGMRRLKEALAEEDPDEFPRLTALELQLRACPAIERRIDESIDDQGELLDGASPELRRLRHRLIILRQRIEEKLRSFLARNATNPSLQDRIVTMRRGRPCIPLRSGAQRSFGGIVHDVSSSGATVFVEPQDVIAHGDELQQVLASEQEEIARILRELSGMVGAQGQELRDSLRAAGDLDFLFARASLSRALEAVEPQLVDDCRLKLMGARHPLLDPATVVPIDVWLGDEFAALLITGPNTGGKTVTLKTVGLLALMAQSGLHVPADFGCELPVFQNVFADIGDDQSIVQSLSTFSSHMGNIARICRGAGPGTLVLLDEVGAGTDPAEGAALAQAVLRFLRERECLVMATTHYNSLKVFALNEPGLTNGSVEFNPETLAPTYHLRIGVPGSSNAMSIASRLGLPSDIIQAARAITGGDSQQVEKVVAKMHKARRQLDRERVAHREARKEFEEKMAALEREAQELREARERGLREGFGEAREIVRTARDEARGILQSLRSQKREGKTTQLASDNLATLAEIVEETAKTVDPPVPEGPALHVGDTVLLRSLGGKKAVVLAEERDGRVRVSVGAVQVDAERADVDLIESAVRDPGLRDQVGALRAAKAVVVPTEINLLGLRVDEALQEVEKYLDDAALAEHESVRIVHGKGTGALREAVRRFLREHRAVREFHDAPLNEGGHGVTIAAL